MKFDITNRFTGAVQFTAEIDCADDAPRSVKLGLSVKWAIKSRANLAGANLAGASLADADLGNAYLADAYLADANLAGANLARANLARAFLADANLGNAYLADANLADAYLADANLAGANLAGASLAHANLARANLGNANLAGANLADAYLADANLAGAAHVAGRVIDGGLRSDGYRFLLTRTELSAWRVKAGCRKFTVDQARAHWTTTRAGTSLGEETLAIIDHMLRIAELREWPVEGEAPRVDAAA